MAGDSSEIRRLSAIARRLGRAAGLASGLPSLWLFTDPARTPDPLPLVARLPRGAGVVYRAFGAADAPATARALALLARARGLVLLVGADADLAAASGAAGVHLPERMIRDLRRVRRQGWIVTAAAHSLTAARAAARDGADGVFLSPVFPSASPSAGAPLGVIRAAQIARATDAPVFALGGVNAGSARRLIGSKIAGLAAIDAFRI